MLGWVCRRVVMTPLGSPVCRRVRVVPDERRRGEAWAGDLSTWSGGGPERGPGPVVPVRKPAGRTGACLTRADRRPGCTGVAFGGFGCLLLVGAIFRRGSLVVGGDSFGEAMCLVFVWTSRRIDCRVVSDALWLVRRRYEARHQAGPQGRGLHHDG